MKRRWLALLLCVALLSGGCTWEQTIVRKVNEPGELDAVEQLKPETLPWENARILDLAPDNQTALMEEAGDLFAYRSGKKSSFSDLMQASDLPDASERIVWSPNCRYAFYQGGEASYVMDLDKRTVKNFPHVQTACFNADQVTLYFASPAPDGGSRLLRQKINADEQSEVLLTVQETLHGAMFRTMKNQYLVMGDNKLLCMEQANAGQPWTCRTVADFAASGITIMDFSYSAQTALCIVSGITAEGFMSFSVVSPDGRDFVIDKTSCFLPERDNPIENLTAAEISALMETSAYSVALKGVQLSPGGLYLLIWGRSATTGAPDMYVLNLDKGALTHVQFTEELEELTQVKWCAGKTLLLTGAEGKTSLASLTGWDD